MNYLLNNASKLDGGDSLMHKKGIAIILSGILLVMTAACGNLNDKKVDSDQTGTNNELTTDKSDENDNNPQGQSGELENKSGGQSGEQSDGEMGVESGEQAEGNKGEVGDTPVEQSGKNNENSSKEPDEEGLLEISNKILELMKKQDFSELSKYIHEEKGVRFTPYSSVDKKIDRCLSASEISGFSDDNEKHMWGYFDGSGFDMSLTNMEYWNQFVWNTDYTAAEDANINKIVQIGNSVENLTEEYPDASFVEYHFSQLEPKNEGMDWCALRLAFEDNEGAWRLVAIIHAQWTI